MKINTHLIVFILILQFLSGYAYAQSTPQQTKEEKKKVEQERKVQEKQAKADAKAAKNSAPVAFQGGYDRFTNVTTTGFQVTTSKNDEVFAGVKIDIGVAASYKGTTVPQNPDDINVRLFIAYTIQSASTARDHSLILLVDNEPMDFGQLQVTTSETYGSSVRFTKAVVVKEVSFATLRRLRDARIIEGRFSGVEFQISPRFIPTLGVLLPKEPISSQSNLSQSQLQEITKATLIRFNDAIQKGDFTDFRNSMSNIRTENVTANSLKNDFTDFINYKLNIKNIDSTDASFVSAQESYEGGFRKLVVEGKYNTEVSIPNSNYRGKINGVGFVLTYLLEEKEWKLLAITIELL
jgi:hypothetical protein